MKPRFRSAEWLAYSQSVVERRPLPGGFATLLNRGGLDELINSETANEVLMINTRREKRAFRSMKFLQGV